MTSNSSQLENVGEKEQICPICTGKQAPLFFRNEFGYLKCRSCKTVSTFPLPTPEQIQKHYSRQFREGNYSIARDFEEDIVRIYAAFTKRLRTHLDTYGKTLQGAKVLDIGCFTGDFLVELRKAGADVYGVEIQKEAVELANQKLPNRVFQANSEGANLLQKGSFDVVTAMGVLEHVTAPSDFFRNAVSMLKPNGILMLQTPDSSSGIARVMGRYWPPFTPVEHIHLLSSRALRDLSKKEGMTDIRISPHWKHLPINYVYQMLSIFGTEFKKFVTPFYLILPKRLREKTVPFYGGEVILLARKSRSDL